MALHQDITVTFNTASFIKFFL